MTMSAATTYNNPLLKGFNPDPSVVYVDGIFYLVTSTFHIFPGLPIYASTDLKTWRLIGSFSYHPQVTNRNPWLTFTRPRCAPS